MMLISQLVTNLVGKTPWSKNENKKDIELERDIHWQKQCIDSNFLIIMLIQTETGGINLLISYKQIIYALDISCNVVLLQH